MLLSGTPQFVAEAIGKALGVERVIGSRCVAATGGSAPSHHARHPFREEKAALVAALAREHGVEATEVTAYGDSIYDLPLLRSVGTAVAVRPDEELADVAAAAGWEVIGPVRRSGLRALLPGVRAAVPSAGTRQ